MGQTVMSQMEIFNKRLTTKKYMNLGGNFYEILKRVKPYLSLIQIFQKVLEAEIKYKLLMEICKESLRRQYGSNRILESTIWVGLYYLLKIDENFV